MAGNRQVFEEAMRQGTDFAWEKQWNKAIVEYQRAVAEFPNEAPAHTALGQALVYVGRTREALDAYQNAARLTPDDPLALERVSELQELSGDLVGALQTWLHIADLHLRRRDVDAAVQVWQHVTEITPGTVAAHERLAKAYAGMDQTRKAIQQFLQLAAIHQQKGDNERAKAACQQALQLNPRSTEVLAALEALQQGRSLQEMALEKQSRISHTTYESSTTRDDGAAPSPVEAAREKALTELAGALLEDNDFESLEATAALLQGVDLQTRGLVDEAISNYEKAIRGGIHHVAAFLVLGLLYQERLEFEEAIEQLQRAAGHPDYAMGAHFALGECLRALGRFDEAIGHYVDVLRQVDLSTIAPENTNELQEIYQDLARRYQTTEKREAVTAFINSLVEFLSRERWHERAFEARLQLNRLDMGRVISLAEILALPNSERILASMVRSREYFESGFLRSASEECLWAIEHAPDYLPLHLHLARLFTQGSYFSMATAKYLAVADALAVRGEMDQARGLYEQVLRMAPMDLDVRQKLIELLLEHRMMDRALEHKLALADACYELAQIEISREHYHEALRMAARADDSQAWTSRILHRLGDIDLQRLDWRSAIEVYSRLTASVPDDEKARERLVELHFNLAHRTEAITELDGLIGLYRHQGNLVKALDLLTELIEAHADELELRKRAAQLSIENGDREGAISHLDAMGEMQLETGHVKEAAATINAIIALAPENVDAYRQLLKQIA